MSNFDQDYTSALFLFSWIVNDELTTEIRPLCQINSFCSSDFTDIIQNFLLYSMRHHIEYLYIATISRQYSVLSGMFDLMDTDRNKVKRDCGRQQHVYYATLCVAQGDCNCWGEGFSLKISVSDSLLWLFLGGKNVITHVFFLQGLQSIQNGIICTKRYTKMKRVHFCIQKYTKVLTECNEYMSMQKYTKV